VGQIKLNKLITRWNVSRLSVLVVMSQSLSAYALIGSTSLVERGNAEQKLWQDHPSDHSTGLETAELPDLMVDLWAPELGPPLEVVRPARVTQPLDVWTVSPSVAKASISSWCSGHGSPGPVLSSGVWRAAIASSVPPGATSRPTLTIAFRRGGSGSACTVKTSTTSSNARYHSTAT